MKVQQGWLPPHEAEELKAKLAAAETQVEELREAIRLTREYVGPDVLPAVAGWSWYDAMLATGGWDERDPSNYDGGTTTDRKQDR